MILDADSGAGQRVGTPVIDAGSHSEPPTLAQVEVRGRSVRIGRLADGSNVTVRVSADGTLVVTYRSAPIPLR
jgi:hypothetical protein